MNERPLRYAKRYRIRRQRDFDRVRRRNVYAADQNLVVTACENTLPYPRLGVVVSRQVGNAVVRNRWKRLIREAFRLQKDRLPTGVDLVVRPRRGAKPDFQNICASLVQLAQRTRRQLRRRRP